MRSYVSIITLATQMYISIIICGGYLSYIHAFPSIFNPYIFAAFLKLIIMVVFQTRYVMTIWKSRNPQSYAQTTQGDGLSNLYIKVYGFCFISVLFIYVLSRYVHFFAFLAFSDWIPQIWLNIQLNTSKPLLP